MENVGKIILCILGLIVAIVISIIVIISFIRFANTPVSELPTWAWWLLH